MKEVTLNPIIRLFLSVLARTTGAKMWDADNPNHKGYSPVTIKWDSHKEPGYPYTVALHGQVVYYAPSINDAVRHGALLITHYA
jgi:hypothetical protein